jgi:hypothetical protein
MVIPLFSYLEKCGRTEPANEHHLTTMDGPMHAKPIALAPPSRDVQRLHYSGNSA